MEQGNQKPGLTQNFGRAGGRLDGSRQIARQRPVLPEDSQTAPWTRPAHEWAEWWATLDEIRDLPAT
jgi:hypothetical protein